MSRENELYTLSIEDLFNEIGECLEFASIKHTHDADDDCIHEYFDLYNESNNLACMDGEQVLVIKDHGDTLDLFSVESEKEVMFTLTLTEFKIAAGLY